MVKHLVMPIPVLALFCCSFAYATSDDPQSSTLACFHGQVRLESYCHTDKFGFVDCKRQTLYADKSKVELVNSEDKSGMRAWGWACTAKEDYLFIYKANGGNCAGCEAYEIYDSKGRQVRNYKGAVPSITQLDLRSSK